MNRDMGVLNQNKNNFIGIMKNTKKVKDTIQGIDGLKGIAIIGVTLFHMFPNSITGGFLGVSLFFLLSGYLLAFTTANQYKKGTYSVKTYAERRIRRILLPLIIMIMVVLGTLYGLVPETLAGIRTEVISILLGYNNWWQISQNADYFTRLANTSPFTHMWFMGIELQYIVAWPIIFWLYRNLSRLLSTRIALLVLTIIALGLGSIMPIMYQPGVDVSRVYFGTDTRVWALLLGAVLGLRYVDVKASTHISKFKKTFGSIFLVTSTLALIVAYVKLNGQDPLTYIIWMPVFTILFAIMVLFVEKKYMTIGKAFDMPLLKWLGHHSYGLFLWQYPVIYIFQKLELLNFFGNEIGYYTAMTAVIFLLTIWIDTVTKWFNSLISWSEFFKAIQSYYVKVVTPVASLVILAGGIAFCMAPADKQRDMNDLQARLEANALSQASANEKNKEVNLADVKDPQEMVNIVAVGDSVMLGAAPALRNDFAGIYIDAKVSRYVGAGLDIFKGINNEGRLGDVVIVGLGTNGPITGYYEEETKALVEYLGDRKIYWINNYAPGISWIDENNAYLEKLAKDHPNIVIIDWASLAAKHRDWLGDDGIHPNDLGVKEYSKFVHDQIKADMLSKSSKDRNGRTIQKRVSASADI